MEEQKKKTTKHAYNTNEMAGLIIILITALNYKV